MYAMDTFLYIGKVQLLELVFLSILALIPMSLACPSACECNSGTNEVSCIGVNLTSIPYNIPHSTSNLDLSNNLIESIASNDLSGFRNIVNLKLEGNVIQRVEDGAMAAIDGLQTLDLSHNRLSIISEKSFVDCSSLMHLDLAYNLLQHVDGAFVDMKELSRLDLSNNQIQRISQFTFRNLKNLRYLLVSSNQITHIDKRAFKNLEKLMYLVLKGNTIHRVNRFEFSSQVLSYVDLSECGLQEVPRGLPNTIRYLQLRRNNFTEIHRRSFKDCPHISILVLDENGLVNIEDRTFDDMHYLKQLWLNGNKLSHIPHPLPPSLERLLMDQNIITQLGNVFPDKSQINTLSFMGNNISYFAFDALSKLSQLTSLDLSNNNIRHIYGHTFLNQSHLKTLQLSKNPLTHFHSRSMWGLYNLKTLSLAYVQTAVSMHQDVFNHVTKLERLNLDSSPWIIRTILSNDKFLNIFISVSDLSMQSCELSYLRSDFPSLLPELLTLHLSSTRWHCDTHLMWLRDWLKETSVNVIEKQEVTCFTPRSVHGRSVESLADDEFSIASTTLSTTTTTSKPLTTFLSTTSTAKIILTALIPTVKTYKPADYVYEREDGSAYDDDEHSHESADRDNSRDIYEYFPVDTYVYEDNRKSSSYTRRPPSWEDYFNRKTLEKPPTKSSTDIPSGEKGYSSDRHWDNSIDSVLSDRITTESNPHHGSVQQSNTNSRTTGSKVTLIIIIVTIVTVVIAAVIIALIIYLVRKMHQNKEPKANGYRNGIKYNHKNDVLYFMPNGKVKREGSTSDSIKTNSTSKEQMTLIPGRDINHEGPLRVYKWEDF